jgi:hypothetical protein
VGCESVASSISGSISERDVCSEVMIFGKKMGQLEGGEDMGKSYSYCLAP